MVQAILNTIGAGVSADWVKELNHMSVCPVTGVNNTPIAPGIKEISIAITKVKKDFINSPFLYFELYNTPLMHTTGTYS